jgi:hypothetical protein
MTWGNTNLVQILLLVSIGAWTQKVTWSLYDMKFLKASNIKTKPKCSKVDTEVMWGVSSSVYKIGYQGGLIVIHPQPS